MRQSESYSKLFHAKYVLKYFSKSPQISMHFILTVRVKLRGFGKVTSICFYSLAHRMLTNRRGQFFGIVSSQLINFSFWKKNIFLLFRPHLPKQLLYLEIHWSQIHWSSGILTRGKKLWKTARVETLKQLQYSNAFPPSFSIWSQMPTLPPMSTRLFREASWSAQWLPRTQFRWKNVSYFEYLYWRELRLVE